MMPTFKTREEYISVLVQRLANLPPNHDFMLIIDTGYGAEVHPSRQTPTFMYGILDHAWKVVDYTIDMNLHASANDPRAAEILDGPMKKAAEQAGGDGGKKN